MESKGPDISGSLPAAVRDLARYKLDLWVYRRLGGTMGTCYEQEIKIFSMERAMTFIYWELNCC